MPDASHPDNLLSSLRILNRIGAAILSELTTEQIVETVYHHVNQLMDAYSFGIGVYNEKNGRFEYTGARENDKKMPDFSIDAHATGRFSAWVFANGKEVLINDFEKEYHLYLPQKITAMQGMEPASLMYVPVFAAAKVAAVLSVRTPLKNAYTQQSLEMLRTLAVFIGKAFENARHPMSQNRRAATLPGTYLLDPLSARELEVLNLLSRGYANRTIAQELFISASTVKTHTLNIYRKLETANRTQAIVKAREYGLIS